MKENFPPEMSKGLKALRSRVRRVQFWRGFWASLAVLVAGLLLVTALDFLFNPPGAARWLLFLAWMGATAAAVWHFLIKPLSHKISLVQIARWMENRHPEIEERVSTAMELSDHPEGVSEELLKDLTEHAQADVKGVDPNLEVTTKRVRRWLWPATALLVLVLGLLAIFPQEYGRLLSRAFTPHKDSGNAGAVKFTIKPGDVEILEGDELVLEFAYEGRDQLEFVKVGDDGERVAEPLLPVLEEEGVKHYRYHVSDATESFQYYATAGKAESDHYEVTVWPEPRLDDLRVTYQEPAYTENPARQTSLARGVEVLERSEIELSGVANTQTEKGRLLIDGEEVGEVEVAS
ncbi:MAG: hypothetical protein ACQKBY_01310, partial [Verrucomicrobiales bacterium]